MGDLRLVAASKILPDEVGVAPVGRARRLRPVLRRRTIGMVELRTGTTHLLTPDALAAGYEVERRYVALRGQKVLPAALAGPGLTYCRSGITVIPTQRSRTSR